MKHGQCSRRTGLRALYVIPVSHPQNITLLSRESTPRGDRVANLTCGLQLPGLGQRCGKTTATQPTSTLGSFGKSLPPLVIKKSKCERDFPAVYKTSELFQGTLFQTHDYVAYSSSKHKGKVEFLGRETNSFSALENPKPKEKHPSFSLLPGSCKFWGRILSKWDTVCKVMICTPFGMDNLFGVILSCPKPITVWQTDAVACVMVCNHMSSRSNIPLLEHVFLPVQLSRVLKR